MMAAREGALSLGELIGTCLTAACWRAIAKASHIRPADNQNIYRHRNHGANRNPLQHVLRSIPASLLGCRGQSSSTLVDI
jgi:hypothetical protein